MQLKTDALSPKGRALNSEKNIEVIGALPGEEVLIQLGGKRKKKRQGFLREILTPSSERVPAKCSHAPDCGGCAFQHWDYSSQLQYKMEVVQKEFNTSQVRPIILCENPWRYRNKMEFSFSQNKAGEKFLGLMLAGSRGRVLALKECFLVSEWFAKVVEAITAWWEGSGLAAYHHNFDTGHLRTLTVREAKQGQGKMVMLTVSGNPAFALKKDQMESFVQALKNVTSEEHLSIFLQIQQIAKGRPTQFFEMPLSGPDHITERLRIQDHTFDCKISPTSFFQPNTLQAEKLYTVGLDMLKLEGARVFDLYCGSGLLGLAAAKRAKEVIGIELNHHAVFDAGWNKEVNQVENFTIYRGDVGQVLEEKKLEKPDSIIVDPPRMGLDDKAMAHILALSPKEILYISCNPKTQAINALALVQAGYRLKVLQPVDQFPHTPHIENIAYFEKA
ncbi:MAG: 23S rRNA (uracil(1939)-C(5))-methyltransferase RlmD [Simkaniaceae bacterium]|nr:23S rRNA (uracil(1939)-C(5))-methyltransferase RlmD [Candidatus Sacchlamyda saccharinae]